jgi:prenylcysteine oxidase/farnesylcysteine lyase
VTGIKTDSDDLRKWYIHTNETESSTPSPPFDAVIFAAPWHGALASLRTQIQTDTVLDRIDRAIPPQPYVHLHVTLLTTTSVHPQGRFFGMDDDAAVPTTVITSAETSRNTGSTSPDFQSITYHGRVAPDSDEWVVKIFSLERRSDEWLGEVFGKDNIGWVLRKEWDSYPK